MMKLRNLTSKRILIAVLAIAGPGLIAANAGNDAGGIATYASAGAQFGYRTLFFMVLVTVALVIVQEMCARLGAYTGEGLGSLIREQFSIRMTTLALGLFVVANIGLVVSEFAGIAAAFQLFNVSRYVSVPIAAVLVWSLVMFGSYRRAERIFLVLSLAFLTYPVAAILSHPHVSQAASQLVWPHFILSKSFLFLGVALIGTTITPYMQFYLAAAIADKGVGPDDYNRERIGAIAGALKAKRLVLLTDVQGVLDRDKKLIKQLRVDEIHALIAGGTITGGMIPKVETCIDALAHGVEGAVILDGKMPHAVLIELLTDHGAGTLITR